MVCVCWLLLASGSFVVFHDLFDPTSLSDISVDCASCRASLWLCVPAAVIVLLHNVYTCVWLCCVLFILCCHVALCVV